MMRTTMRNCMKISMVACMLVFMAASQMCSANLLANGGFESGFDLVYDSMHSGQNQGWTYLVAGETSNAAAYLGAETTLGAYQAPISIKDGIEALRMTPLTYPLYGRVTMNVYQDISVAANTGYVASVWARVFAVAGVLGYNADDAAGLWIQEFDSAGGLVANHTKVLLDYNNPNSWANLTDAFTTSSTTASVRYTLYGDANFNYNAGTNYQGYYTFDSGELSTVPEPSGLLALCCGIPSLLAFAVRRRK